MDLGHPRDDFSVAKPFAALAFLDAVAEGHLCLDQLVTSVWPAYGQAGKQSTTMRHLLDEVLRRATGEPLVERFTRVAAGAGWDLHLRVAPRDLGRVATLVEPTGR